MAYAEGRVFHDADAHVMETPDWLMQFASRTTTRMSRAAAIRSSASRTASQARPSA